MRSPRGARVEIRRAKIRKGDKRVERHISAKIMSYCRVSNGTRFRYRAMFIGVKDERRRSFIYIDSRKRRKSKCTR